MEALVNRESYFKGVLISLGFFYSNQQYDIMQSPQFLRQEDTCSEVRRQASSSFHHHAVIAGRAASVAFIISQRTKINIALFSHGRQQPTECLWTGLWCDSARTVKQWRNSLEKSAVKVIYWSEARWTRKDDEAKRPEEELWKEEGNIWVNPWSLMNNVQLTASLISAKASLCRNQCKVVKQGVSSSGQIRNEKWLS